MERDSHKTETRTLKSVSFTADEKTIELALRENARGRFLTIMETKVGRRNMVALPETGFEPFLKQVAEILA